MNLQGTQTLQESQNAQLKQQEELGNIFFRGFDPATFPKPLRDEKNPVGYSGFGRPAEQYYKLLHEDTQNQINEGGQAENVIPNMYNQIKQKNIYGENSHYPKDWLSYLEQQPDWGGDNYRGIYDKIRQQEAEAQAKQQPTPDEEKQIADIEQDLPNVFSNALNADLSNVMQANIPIADANNTHFNNTMSLYSNILLKTPNADSRYNKTFDPSEELVQPLLGGRSSANNTAAQQLQNFYKFSLIPNEKRGQEYNISNEMQDWHNTHYGNMTNVSPRLSEQYPETSPNSLFKDTKPLLSELKEQMIKTWGSLWSKSEQEEPEKDQEQTDAKAEQTQEINAARLKSAAQHFTEKAIKQIMEHLKKTKQLPASIGDAPYKRDLEKLHEDENILNAASSTFHMYDGDQAAEWKPTMSKMFKRAALPYLNPDLIYENTLDDFLDKLPDLIKATDIKRPEEILSKYDLAASSSQSLARTKGDIKGTYEKLVTQPRQKEEMEKRLQEIKESPEDLEMIIDRMHEAELERQEEKEIANMSNIEWSANATESEPNILKDFAQLEENAQKSIEAVEKEKKWNTQEEFLKREKEKTDNITQELIDDAKKVEEEIEYGIDYLSDKFANAREANQKQIELDEQKKAPKESPLDIVQDAFSEIFGAAANITQSIYNNLPSGTKTDTESEKDRRWQQLQEGVTNAKKENEARVAEDLKNKAPTENPWDIIQEILPSNLTQSIENVKEQFDDAREVNRREKELYEQGKSSENNQLDMLKKDLGILGDAAGNTAKKIYNWLMGEDGNDVEKLTDNPLLNDTIEAKEEAEQIKEDIKNAIIEHLDDGRVSPQVLQNLTNNTHLEAVKQKISDSYLKQKELEAIQETLAKAINQANHTQHETDKEKEAFWNKIMKAQRKADKYRKRQAEYDSTKAQIAQEKKALEKQKQKEIADMRERELNAKKILDAELEGQELIKQQEQLAKAAEEEKQRIEDEINNAIAAIDAKEAVRIQALQRREAEEIARKEKNTWNDNFKDALQNLDLQQAAKIIKNMKETGNVAIHDLAAELEPMIKEKALNETEQVFETFDNYASDLIDTLYSLSAFNEAIDKKVDKLNDFLQSKTRSDVQIPHFSTDWDKEHEYDDLTYEEYYKDVNDAIRSVKKTDLVPLKAVEALTNLEPNLADRFALNHLQEISKQGRDYFVSPTHFETVEKLVSNLVKADVTKMSDEELKQRNNLIRLYKGDIQNNPIWNHDYDAAKVQKNIPKLVQNFGALPIIVTLRDDEQGKALKEEILQAAGVTPEFKKAVDFINKGSYTPEEYLKNYKIVADGSKKLYPQGSVNPLMEEFKKIEQTYNQYQDLTKKAKSQAAEKQQFEQTVANLEEKKAVVEKDVNTALKTLESPTVQQLSTEPEDKIFQSPTLIDKTIHPWSIPLGKATTKGKLLVDSLKEELNQNTNHLRYETSPNARNKELASYFNTLSPFPEFRNKRFDAWYASAPVKKEAQTYAELQEQIRKEAEKEASGAYMHHPFWANTYWRNWQNQYKKPHTVENSNTLSGKQMIDIPTRGRQATKRETMRRYVDNWSGQIEFQDFENGVQRNDQYFNFYANQDPIFPAIDMIHRTNQEVIDLLENFKDINDPEYIKLAKEIYDRTYDREKQIAEDYQQTTNSGNGPNWLETALKDRDKLFDMVKDYKSHQDALLRSLWRDYNKANNPEVRKELESKLLNTTKEILNFGRQGIKTEFPENSFMMVVPKDYDMERIEGAFNTLGTHTTKNEDRFILIQPKNNDLVTLNYEFINEAAKHAPNFAFNSLSDVEKIKVLKDLDLDSDYYKKADEESKAQIKMMKEKFDIMMEQWSAEEREKFESEDSNTIGSVMGILGLVGGLLHGNPMGILAGIL